MLIGGCLAAVTDFQLAKRREEADGRSGARLVQEDLRSAADTVANCLRFDHWLGPVSPPSRAWEEYRAVLASVLAVPAWRAVVSAMRALHNADAYAAAWLRETKDVTAAGKPLDGAARATLKKAEDEVRAGYNALADLAGVESEDALAAPAPWDDWPGE